MSGAYSTTDLSNPARCRRFQTGNPSMVCQARGRSFGRAVYAPLDPIWLRGIFVLTVLALAARMLIVRSWRRRQFRAIHIAIHNNFAYDVLPMTYSAVRALLCR